MRKKMMFLALALAATASLTARRTAAADSYGCPICTTYADGSQCCISCVCSGHGIACTDHYCPPADGGGGIN
jgi:hypothetical protein